MGISLSVLGPLTLAVDGESVGLPPAQRRVLATIASHGGRDVTTDALIERVWSANPPANARTSLHVHVSGLRQAAPDIIETEGSWYRLHPDVTLDRVVFESLIEAAEAAAMDKDWDVVLRSSTIALSQWRGDPYPELVDDVSMGAETLRLKERRLEIIELHMRALLALGRYAEALPELQALTTQHPLHERFRYLLMLALYQGGRQVEALRTHQEFRTMLGEEVGIEPDVSLRLLEERILLQDPALGDPIQLSTPNNLPASTTSFLGREAAFEKIAVRLATSRLITITGGPGFGKTRLAVELGHSLLESYPGGVWFAGLADARSVRDVTATIAAATTIQDEVSGVHELAKKLAAHQMLLILDNCEHVLEACAAFATATLIEGGNLRIVATSRTALSVEGEQVWQLDPLSVPNPSAIGIDEALASPAVRLFMDRAKAVDRTFALTEESVPEILHLSRQLAGIPLAIELASRWVPALGVSEITAMLDPGLSIATDDPNGAPASLRAAIDWSLALLPEEDRRLVADAAIFSGSFALADIRAVCSKESNAPEFAAAMSRIVASSLLQTDRKPDGSVRYRMLVPIREFLLALQTPGHDELQTRFARHYLSMASSWQIDRFSTVVDISTIDENIENLRAAMDSALKRNMPNEVALALVPLTGYFTQRYLSWESKAWIERTLRFDLDPLVKASVLRSLGSIAEILGELDESREIFGRSLDIYATHDDPEGRARCLVSLAGVQSHRGEWEDGLSTAQEAYRLVEAFDHEAGLAMASYYIGENLGNAGNVTAAVPHLLDSADHFERAGESVRGSYVMSRLTVLAVLVDDETLGRSALTRAESLARESNSDYHRVKLLSAAALVEAEWGDATWAASRLLDAKVPIERAHPDEVREFLLPAAAVLVRFAEWELVSEIVAWGQFFFDRSPEALPVPWAVVMDRWAASAASTLDGSTLSAAAQARISSLESLVQRTLTALRRITADGDKELAAIDG